MAGIRPQRGVAAVEFASLLPLFLTLLFGVVELSFALYDKAIITNASREAARAGIVYAKPRLTSTQISNIAVDYATELLVTFGSSEPPIVAVDQSAGTAPGSPLKVTVTYSYKGLVLTSFVSKLTSPILLSASTVMSYE
jgi:Flp pilus assembly protein TadG